LPDNQAFPLIRWETEPRRVETRHALSLLPDAKPMEDLGEVKSVDNQGICDGNSQTSRMNVIFYNVHPISKMKNQTDFTSILKEESVSLAQ